MRRILIILAALLALAGSAAHAQTVKASNYSTLGYIKSDGTMQDASYRVIGHIKSDGTVQDASYRIVGNVKKDGTVQDASYRNIGHADDVPMAWTAYFFFFFRK